MTGGAFVSYAQHGEDVVLWRALGARPEVVYVDVGAYDPTEDSVTRALYERGWHGVNIEPQPDRIERFLVERPRDVNLAVAVGDTDGTGVLAVPAVAGWATMLTEDESGRDPVENAHVDVPVRRLDTLLAELGIEHVDVLKIDVEGAEPAVVRGLLGGPVRPTVCVVEGVAAEIGRAPGDEAVALLTAAGYTHCQFDGLNHYLTTDADLVPALSVPANPVDDFVLHTVDRLAREQVALQATIAALAEENLRLRREASPEPAGVSELPAPAAADDLTTDAQVVGAQDLRQAAATLVVPPAPVQPAETRAARRRSTVERILQRDPVGESARAGGVHLTLLDAGPQPADIAVPVLYREVLGRRVDAHGLEAWLEAVSQGTSLVEIVNGLVGSAEFTARPAAIRSAATAAVHEWRRALAREELDLASAELGGFGEGTIGDEIFVRAVFEVALRRRPTHDELAVEVSKLRQGSGREHLIRTFAARPDVRARLAGSPGASLRSRARRLLDGRSELSTFRALVTAAESRHVQRVLADDSTPAARPLSLLPLGGV